MMFSKPVIAAVEGYAVAGGMELSLMCDMRIVDEHAIMGIFCRRFGKSPPSLTGKKKHGLNNRKRMINNKSLTLFM